MLHQPRHRFSSRTHVQLLVDVSDVSVDGADADAEFVGDFLGTIATGQLPQNFRLTIRKLHLGGFR